MGSIEDGDFRIFPGPAYITGFLRNYSTFLGLNPDEILQTYHAIRPPEAITIEPATTIGVERMRRRARKKFSWVATSLVLVLIFFAAVDAYGSHNPTANLPRQGSSVHSKSTSGLNPKPSTTPTLTPSRIAIIALRAHRTGWVHVKIDNKFRYWGVLRANHYQAWTGKQVSVRSPHGADFTAWVNGKKIGTLSGKHRKYANLVRVTAKPGAWRRGK